MQYVPLISVVQNELDLAEVDAGEPVLDELELVPLDLKAFDL